MVAINTLAIFKNDQCIGLNESIESTSLMNHIALSDREILRSVDLGGVEGLGRDAPLQMA
jgi:hypothetical protein